MFKHWTDVFHRKCQSSLYNEYIDYNEYIHYYLYDTTLYIHHYKFGMYQDTEVDFAHIKPGSVKVIGQLFDEPDPQDYPERRGIRVEINGHYYDLTSEWTHKELLDILEDDYDEELLEEVVDILGVKRDLSKSKDEALKEYVIKHAKIAKVVKDNPSLNNFIERINELQDELKQAKANIKNLCHENEKYKERETKYNDDLNTLENENKVLKETITQFEKEQHTWKCELLNKIRQILEHHFHTQ